MHALIRQGNGKFYVSAVFGYYKDVTAEDSYQRYLEEIHKPYWIVWDKDKRRLIRWLDMVPNTKYLIPQILIIDSEDFYFCRSLKWLFLHSMIPSLFILVSSLDIFVRSRFR